MGYVYCYVFPNGKRYVGATTLEPEERTGKNGSKYNGKVREAIDLYGWENIEQHWFPVPDELLDDTERSVIQWLRTTDTEYGYNQQSGGKKGFKTQHSEETRKKMSETWIGHSVSEETRKKISNSRRGITHTEEARRKISEAGKGRHPSEETRRKLSESQTGHSVSEETRRKISEASKLMWAKKKGLA